MRLFNRLVILIAVFLLAIPLSFAQQNLIRDGGFEQSPHIHWGNWGDWGPGKRDFDNTERARSGLQCYKVEVTNLTSRWNSDIALQEDILDIEQGDRFEASAYILIPEDDPLSEHVEAYLEVIFFDGKGKGEKNEVGKFQSKKYGYGKPQGQWRKLVINDTAPQGAKACKLQLVVLPLPYLSDDKKDNESYSGTIYFDDVKLTNKSRILR